MPQYCETSQLTEPRRCPLPLLSEGDQPVSSFSGGWRMRIGLGKILLKDPNILLLDEPTNHLDMESIEALNLALEHYEGTLIFVSHDREFVSSLATRIVEIKNRRLVDFKGTYDEYLSQQS